VLLLEPDQGEMRDVGGGIAAQTSGDRSHVSKVRGPDRRLGPGVTQSISSVRAQRLQHVIASSVERHDRLVHELGQGILNGGSGQQLVRAHLVDAVQTRSPDEDGHACPEQPRRI
jgi:hypothetical protein